MEHDSAETNQELIKRLRIVEGHVRGVQRMVEEGAYCIDILRQTLAIRRALEKFDTQVLNQHLHHCVTDAIRSTDSADQEKALTEILEIFAATRG